MAVTIKVMFFLEFLNLIQRFYCVRAENGNAYSFEYMQKSFFQYPGKVYTPVNGEIM